MGLFADRSGAKGLSDDFENKEAKEILQEIMSQKSQKGPTSIIAEDVIDWAEKNLPASVDVEWELEKFKDYHRYTNKKPPKDAVAAFRNWLRKASENNHSINEKKLKFGEPGYDHYQNKTNKKSINTCRQTTGFERFITGGIRALDKFKRSGLEREVN